MNELFSTWLFDLGRITLVLSVAALAVGFALRFIRPTTIRLHRTAWCLVLLIGWLFVRLPVSIPWYEPEVVPVQKEIVASEFPETGFPASKNLALEPLPDNLPKDLPVNLFADAATLDKMAVPLEEIKASKPVLEPQKPETPSSAVKPIPVDVPASAGDGTNPFHWGLALLVVWILGMIVTLLRWLLGYVRSLRSMSTALQPDDVSARQWQTLLAEQGIDREIPLRLTENMGPLLCRWPDGYELVVPAKLWESLSPSVRLSVMRHELAHYQRGDVWKSLVMRILALPHWFNPAAWWAVRRFEEAAEWACDEAAIGNDVRSTDYARTLLAIAEASLGAGSCHPSMSRLNLSARIRRLVTSQTRKDSIMKKTTLTTLAILLLAFCLVRIELVAKTPTTETTTQVTAESSDQNASTETQAPPENKSAPLRYNGKTFDEWKKNLDAETNPEQLCDAIEAFVALGIQENRSEEAAKLIAGLMQTHSYSLGTDWPDDQTVLLKAIHVFMGQKLDEGSYVKVDNAIPYEIGIPVLCQELEQGNDKSRSFVLTVFAHLLGDDRPYVPVALSDQTVVDSVRKQVIPSLTKFVKIEDSERLKSYALQILACQQDSQEFSLSLSRILDGEIVMTESVLLQKLITTPPILIAYEIEQDQLKLEPACRKLLLRIAETLDSENPQVQAIATTVLLLYLEKLAKSSEKYFSSSNSATTAIPIPISEETRQFLKELTWQAIRNFHLKDFAERAIPNVNCEEADKNNAASSSGFWSELYYKLTRTETFFEFITEAAESKDDSLSKPAKAILTEVEESTSLLGSYETQIEKLQQIDQNTRPCHKLEFRILANRQDHDELIRLAEKSDETQVLDDQGKRLAWWVPVKAKEVEKFKANLQDRIITRTVKHDGIPRLEVLVVNDPHNVTDAFLRRADTNINAYGHISIRFLLSKTGGERLGKLTSENLPDERTGIKRHLGIIINGELFSAPLVLSTIKDAGLICGDFTQQEAESIVDLLTPVKPTTPATENKSPNVTINANGGTFTSDRISLTLADKKTEETNPQLGVSITSSNSYDKDGVTALVKITVENRGKTPLENVEIKFSSGQAFKWDSVTATYQLEDGNLVWKRDSLPPHTSIEYLVRGKITSQDNPPLCWAHVSSAQGVNAETLYVPNIHGAVWAADLVPIDEKPAVQEQEPEPAISVATKPKSPTDENYRIEPPDVLRIELDKVVPKKPYRLAAYDVIQIKAINTLLNHPIDGYFLIESEGHVNLGPAYGTVKVVDMTTEEAEKAILKQLETTLKGPRVTVELMRAAGMLPITGTYLVGPDGTINLKKYGQIHVADLTMAHAKLVVQKHLEKWLESPKVSMDIGKYQSKHYYLVIAREGLRSNIVRVPFVGNETILDAIALIHDFDASKVKIQIARPNSNGGQLLNVDCFKLNTLTNSNAGGYHLQPNDRVLVLQRKTTESQNELPMPHEGFMTNLPTYRIEPPDLIQIEGIKLVPIKQEITPGDVLEINAINLLIKAPIKGYYDVDSEGQVSLGPAYGKVKVSGMTAKEARDAIQKHLETTIIDPEVSLQIAKSSSVKPITGTYLVGPDGTVNLRTYGSVQVSGKAIVEARKVIEEHLSKSLLNPVVSVDVAAYNSKVFYIIQKSEAGGDNVTTIPITGRETVLDALSRLQGLADFFKVTSIRLVRISQDKSENSLPIDYQSIITGRDTKTNYQIFPGDRLYIESPKPEK